MQMNSMMNSVVRNICLLAITFSCTQAEAQLTFPDSLDNCEKLALANNALNSTYIKLYREYETNAEFVYELERSQRVWVEYRMSLVLMTFPKQHPEEVYGETYEDCVCKVKTEATLERLAWLRRWEFPELYGDECSGSAGVK